mgnify:CR=1 FL=1
MYNKYMMKKALDIDVALTVMLSVMKGVGRWNTASENWLIWQESVQEHYGIIDEIDLLKPCKVNENGMRFYGKQEVDLLQQIMFYREHDVKLDVIQQIIHQPDLMWKKL